MDQVCKVAVLFFFKFYFQIDGKRQFIFSKRMLRQRGLLRKLDSPDERGRKFLVKQIFFRNIPRYVSGLLLFIFKHRHVLI